MKLYDEDRAGVLVENRSATHLFQQPFESPRQSNFQPMELNTRPSNSSSFLPAYHHNVGRKRKIDVCVSCSQNVSDESIAIKDSLTLAKRHVYGNQPSVNRSEVALNLSLQSSARSRPSDIYCDSLLNSEKISNSTYQSHIFVASSDQHISTDEGISFNNSHDLPPPRKLLKYSQHGTTTTATSFSIHQNFPRANSQALSSARPNITNPELRTSNICSNTDSTFTRSNNNYTYINDQTNRLHTQTTPLTNDAQNKISPSVSRDILRLDIDTPATTSTNASEIERSTSRQNISQQNNHSIMRPTYPAIFPPPCLMHHTLPPTGHTPALPHTTPFLCCCCCCCLSRKVPYDPQTALGSHFPLYSFLVPPPPPLTRIEGRADLSRQQGVPKDYYSNISQPRSASRQFSSALACCSYAASRHPGAAHPISEYACCSSSPYYHPHLLTDINGSEHIARPEASSFAVPRHPSFYDIFAQSYQHHHHHHLFPFPTYHPFHHRNNGETFSCASPVCECHVNHYIDGMVCLHGAIPSCRVPAPPAIPALVTTPRTPNDPTTSSNGYREVDNHHTHRADQINGALHWSQYHYPPPFNPALYPPLPRLSYPQTDFSVPTGHHHMGATRYSPLSASTTSHPLYPSQISQSTANYHHPDLGYSIRAQNPSFATATLSETIEESPTRQLIERESPARPSESSSIVRGSVNSIGANTQPRRISSSGRSRQTANSSTLSNRNNTTHQRSLALPSLSTSPTRVPQLSTRRHHSANRLFRNCRDAAYAFAAELGLSFANPSTDPSIARSTEVPLTQLPTSGSASSVNRRNQFFIQFLANLLEESRRHQINGGEGESRRELHNSISLQQTHFEPDERSHTLQDGHINAPGDVPNGQHHNSQNGDDLHQNPRISISSSSQQTRNLIHNTARRFNSTSGFRRRQQGSTLPNRRPRIPANLRYLATNSDNYEALLTLTERLGEVKPKGLTKLDIECLVCFRFNPEIHGCNAANNGISTCCSQTSCIICMSEFEARTLIRVMPCNHEYHSKCIDRWLKNNRTCPICRCDIAERIATIRKKLRI